MATNSQPPESPAGQPEGPVTEGRRRHRRLVTVLSALTTLVLLPMLVWGIETYGPKGVSALQSGAPPVTVVLQGQDTGSGAGFVFPRGQSLTPGPDAGCNNFLRWAHEKGGFLETESENLLIIVQGKIDQQAVIESLRPRILSRQPLPRGEVINGCQKGKGSILTHDLISTWTHSLRRPFPWEETFRLTR